MNLHPFPHDGDHHQQDARTALKTGRAVRADNPWCACKVHQGGIITCRGCGRMRYPQHLATK